MDGVWLFGQDQYFLRTLSVRDAALRLDFFLRNRDVLEPFMPLIPSSEYTLIRQRLILQRGTEDMNEDRRYLFGIFSAQMPHRGPLLGYVNLNNVIRGAFQSCDIGYAMDRESTGQGIMTQAVQKVSELAFSCLHLHRIQAAVIMSNQASIRVAEKSGFQRIGLSRHYLKIHGIYQDHVLMDKISTLEE